MFSRIVLIVLLAAVAQARGATEPQGVEAKAVNEHLAAAVTAYRSALEVYSAEAFPLTTTGWSNN